jgi:hypothetical protein
VSAHVASVVRIARAGSNKGQIGGAGALHAPERFERYIQEGLAWVPFYNGDTDIRGPTNSGPSSSAWSPGSQRRPIRASEPSSTGRIAGHRGPRAAGASLLVRLIMGRWTLRLLAELSGGGRRYHDLHDALGGSHTRSHRHASTSRKRRTGGPLAALDRWTASYWHEVEAARQHWNQRSE